MADGIGPSLKAFYGKHTKAIWAVAVAAPVLVVGVGLLVAPDIFWDHFLWEDIWGPTVADGYQWRGACLNPDGSYSEAQGTGTALTCPQDDAVLANEGYTITSEITYGLVLAAALYAIYRQVFQRYRVRVDGFFVLALMPYILLGPFGRVLEDANVFINPGSGEPVKPFAYLFISPWIYMAIAAFTLLGLGLGIFLARRRDTLSANLATAVMGAYLAALVSGYALLWNRQVENFAALPRPGSVLIAALLGLAFYWWMTRRNGASVNLTLFTAGIPLAAPAIILVARWVFGIDRWAGPPAWRGGTFPLAGGIMVGLALAVALTVGLIGYLLRNRSETFALYTNPLNLALVFGHMMDGFATWIAIKDPFNLGLAGYGEKHPVSDVLLDYLGGFGFPLVKFVMIILVIYLLDKEFKKDLETDRNLVGLVKMAIFVLGFAPGLRDVLRVMMGL